MTKNVNVSDQWIKTLVGHSKEVEDIIEDLLVCGVPSKEVIKITKLIGHSMSAQFLINKNDK